MIHTSCLLLIKLSVSLIQRGCFSPPCNTQKRWIISSAQREQGGRWRTVVALGPSANNVERQWMNYSRWCWMWPRATASIRLLGERCSINAFKYTALSHLFINDYQYFPRLRCCWVTFNPENQRGKNSVSIFCLRKLGLFM